MKKYLKNNQKGTSLIELLLYVAILSVIFIVAIDLIIASGALKQESESQSSLQSDAAFLTNRLSYEIRNADAVTTPSALGQTSNSLVLTTGPETHTFSLNAGFLQYQKTVSSSTTTALLNSNLAQVSNFSVQNLGNVGGKRSFRIDFTLTDSKATQQGNLSKSYEIIATLR